MNSSVRLMFSKTNFEDDFSIKKSLLLIIKSNKVCGKNAGTIPLKGKIDNL